jgi:uncharacterized membrane protein
MPLSKIQAESMNLADTYAFTGTVSGASNETHVLLSSVTSSASTTNHDITGVFSSTYSTYFIEVTMKPENSNYQYEWQFLDSSNNPITSGYYGGIYGYRDNDTSAGIRSSSTASGRFSNDGSNSRLANFQCYVIAPFSTESNLKRLNFTGGYFGGTNVFTACSGSMWNTSTTSCTGIRFKTNGTPINRFACQVYGIRSTTI